MIAAPGDIQLETLQVDAAAEGQTCTMTAPVLTAAYFHRTVFPEIDTAAKPYLTGKEDVCTDGKMFDHLVVPMGEVYHGGREAEWGTGKFLAHTGIQ